MFQKNNFINKEDVLGTIKYVIDLNNGDQNVHTDDIDNLSNRRIRGVGELLLMQIKTGLAKMNKMVEKNDYTRHRNSNSSVIVEY